MRAVWRHLGECGWFWAWSVIGALMALGFVSLGLLLLLPVAGLAFLIDRKAHPPDHAALGVISGFGLLFLVVAYINRDGPSDPLHWGGVGVLLLAIGMGAFAFEQRRARGTRHAA